MPDVAPTAVCTRVSACIAPLLRWVLSWWQGDDLALAFDVTPRYEQVIVLAVSVL